MKYHSNQLKGIAFEYFLICLYALEPIENNDINYKAYTLKQCKKWIFNSTISKYMNLLYLGCLIEGHILKSKHLFNIFNDWKASSTAMIEHSIYSSRFNNYTFNNLLCFSNRGRFILNEDVSFEEAIEVYKKVLPKAFIQQVANVTQLMKYGFIVDDNVKHLGHCNSLEVVEMCKSSYAYNYCYYSQGNKNVLTFLRENKNNLQTEFLSIKIFHNMNDSLKSLN